MRFILKFHRQEVIHGEVISIWKSCHGNGMKCLFHVTLEQSNKKTPHIWEKKAAVSFIRFLFDTWSQRNSALIFWMFSEDIHINKERNKINTWRKNKLALNTQHYYYLNSFKPLECMWLFSFFYISEQQTWVKISLMCCFSFQKQPVIQLNRINSSSCSFLQELKRSGN